MKPICSEIKDFCRVIEVERDALGEYLLACNGVAHSGVIKKAVMRISECHGSVILLGVGKSGLIARKIAATFASFGQRAIFLHPTEMMHGDMGNVMEGDIAIFISNSGETDELLSVIPVIRMRGVFCVGIIGRHSSSIEKVVDLCLHSPVQREACGLNLAPTASTTLALAIGDALAVASSMRRGITSKHFASNHPSGRLGKRLTLRVVDIMVQLKSCAQISPTTLLREVIIEISKRHTNCAVVVGEAGLLLGFITDGDIRRALLSGKEGEQLNIEAKSIMTAQPIKISPEALAVYAVELMSTSTEYGLESIPVVDCLGLVLGVIHKKDILNRGL